MDIVQSIEQIPELISPIGLLLILVLISIVSLVLIFVFFYHWDRYGTNSTTTFRLKLIYSVGVLVFLGVAMSALLSY